MLILVSFLKFQAPSNQAACQVWVYSGRGPVKSGRKQTEDEGRGLDKRLVQPELVTAWIQRLRIMSVDPLRRFRSRGVDGDRQRRTRTGVDDYG